MTIEAEAEIRRKEAAEWFSRLNQRQVTTVDAPGFLTGLENGWAAFVSLIMVAITALGFFLPFLLVLMIIAIPVTLVIVRQSRRHRRTVPQPQMTLPAPTSEEAGTPSST